MVETIHVLQKEQEMGNIKACFLMLVFLLNFHLSVYIKSNMADWHFRGAFLSPVNTFGCYTAQAPAQLQFTYVPGASRRVSAKDQVGDGSVRLMPPSEHRFCCPTKVCVWTLKSIEQKSHRAVGSSLQAFRQILQILKRGRPDAQSACTARQQTACYSRISDQWVWCAGKLIYWHTDLFLPKGYLEDLSNNAAISYQGDLDYKAKFA